eukprot:scaffold191464_cov58-Attheya_sp.AAC.2
MGSSFGEVVGTLVIGKEVGPSMGCSLGDVVGTLVAGKEVGPSVVVCSLKLSNNQLIRRVESYRHELGHNNEALVDRNRFHCCLIRFPTIQC